MPGDYDAQTSIHWGMSRHALEHLASTDRGVIMTRNIIRRGIQAVQKGRTRNTCSGRKGRSCPRSPTIRSSSHLAATPEADVQYLRETGRTLAEGYLKDPASLVDSPQ